MLSVAQNSLSAFCTADVPAGLLGNNEPETLSIRVEASSSRNHFAGAKVGKPSRRALVGSHRLSAQEHRTWQRRLYLKRVPSASRVRKPSRSGPCKMMADDDER